jgi:hypothetical protein
MGGNGNATTILGEVYAPTAAVTMNGGGSSGGVNVAGLDIGTISTCNGGGSVLYNLVVGSTFIAGMSVTPDTTNIDTGQKNGARISVFGLGPRAPTGTVTVFQCGPVVPGDGCGTTYPMHQVGPVLSLTQGATAIAPSTAATSTTVFAPPNPGTYCFAATYSGDVSYGQKTDATTDGCFTVSGPPAPDIIDPVDGDCYRSNPNGGCPNSWLGYIDGRATDPGGPGVQSVQVAVQAPDGTWWNPGTGAFTSSTPVNMIATDTSGNNTWSTWRLPFSAINLQSSNSSYTVLATATDKATPPVSGLSDSVGFTWKG